MVEADGTRCLPCTDETTGSLGCDPKDEFGPCPACPPQRAYAGVECCVLSSRDMSTMAGEFYYLPILPLRKEGATLSSKKAAMRSWHCDSDSPMGISPASTSSSSSCPPPWRLSWYVLWAMAWAPVEEEKDEGAGGAEQEQAEEEDGD